APAGDGRRPLDAPPLEAREDGEDALDVVGDAPVRARVGAHLEVLEDGETVEDTPSLGDMGDAAEHAVVGGDAEEGGPIQAHVAAAGGEEAGQRLEGGGLARPVIAESGDD